MSRAKLDPHHPFKRDPLPPHRMQDRMTRAEDVVVLCHLGVARLDRESWSLTIDGMVERPRMLRFEELTAYPKVELTTVHQCCGNPLAPREPTRRIANVTWAGVRVADVLADARPQAAARYVWSQGADHGEFAGVAVDAFVKDLPLDRVANDVLLAYELNGSALPAEHGFPVRLVVPGFYGTNSVKWLTRMTLAETRAPGPFTTRWYNDPVLDRAGHETGATQPVWSIAPESIVVSPAVDAVVRRARPCEIWGWAWADTGIGHVQVSTDDGKTWQPAQLEPRRGREWQRFSLQWTPDAQGAVVIAAKAEAEDGQVQPAGGWRNAFHRVPVTVG